MKRKTLGRVSNENCKELTDVTDSIPDLGHKWIPEFENSFRDGFVTGGKVCKSKFSHFIFNDVLNL